MGLEQDPQKRNFSNIDHSKTGVHRTPEQFITQKHAGSHLYYDAPDKFAELLKNGSVSGIALWANCFRFNTEWDV